MVWYILVYIFGFGGEDAGVMESGAVCSVDTVLHHALHILEYRDG
jgi:hypothetical protein